MSSHQDNFEEIITPSRHDMPVENPDISHLELHFLIPDSRAVFDLIFTLSHTTHLILWSRTMTSFLTHDHDVIEITFLSAND
jgi:hypothetical protein